MYWALSHSLVRRMPSYQRRLFRVISKVRVILRIEEWVIFSWLPAKLEEEVNQDKEDQEAEKAINDKLLIHTEAAQGRLISHVGRSRSVGRWLVGQWTSIGSLKCLPQPSREKLYRRFGSVLIFGYIICEQRPAWFAIKLWAHRWTWTKTDVAICRDKWGDITDGNRWWKGGFAGQVVVQNLRCKIVDAVRTGRRRSHIDVGRVI